MFNLLTGKDKKVEPIKQCSFRCPDTTWKRFKMHCLTENITCQDKLAELIMSFIESTKDKKKGAGTQSKRHIRSLS